MKIAEGIELDPKAFRKQSGIEERFVRLDEGNFKWGELDKGEKDHLILKPGSGYGARPYLKYDAGPGYAELEPGDAQEVLKIVKANAQGGQIEANLDDDLAEIEITWKGYNPKRLNTKNAEKIMGKLVQAGFAQLGPTQMYGSGPDARNPRFRDTTTLGLYVTGKK